MNLPGRSLAARALTLLMISFASSRCGGTAPAKSPPEPGPARLQHCRLYVESSNSTNDGNVLSALVRHLDLKTARTTESYEDATVLVVTEPPDATVVTVRAIVPGRTAIIDLQVDPSERILAYFFFTNPGPNWRIELPTPLPSELRVELGRYQVEHVYVSRSR